MADRAKMLGADLAVDVLLSVCRMHGADLTFGDAQPGLLVTTRFRTADTLAEH